MVKLADIAYVAGLFDGEGSIAISRHKAYQPQWSVTHHLNIKITNTDLDVLLWLKEAFGGYVFDHHNVRDCPTHRPSWNWALVSGKAKLFLELIKPYARIKNKEIDIALKFASLKRKRGTRLTSYQISERDEYRLALMEARSRECIKEIRELNPL